MSFLVLVLGVLLSVGGAISLVSGYGVVEIDRGSTAVIAGTTALAAGVMTIGIGFILRCLVRLQAFLEAEKGIMPLLNEVALNRHAFQPRRAVPQPAGIEGSPSAAESPAALVAAVPATSPTAIEPASDPIAASPSGDAG